MAKKRKEKKGKIKRKRTANKNNPKKRSSRKPGLRVVATTSEKEEAEIPQARTPRDIFQGINGRRPKSNQELNEWLASPEGKAAMAFEPTSLSRFGETGRS
jgi:hypothetical protein